MMLKYIIIISLFLLQNIIAQEKRSLLFFSGGKDDIYSNFEAITGVNTPSVAKGFVIINGDVDTTETIGSLGSKEAVAFMRWWADYPAGDVILNGDFSNGEVFWTVWSIDDGFVTDSGYVMIGSAGSGYSSILQQNLPVPMFIGDDITVTVNIEDYHGDGGAKLYIELTKHGEPGMGGRSGGYDFCEDAYYTVDLDTVTEGVDWSTEVVLTATTCYDNNFLYWTDVNARVGLYLESALGDTLTIGSIAADYVTAVSSIDSVPGLIAALEINDDIFEDVEYDYDCVTVPQGGNDSYSEGEDSTFVAPLSTPIFENAEALSEDSISLAWAITSNREQGFVILRADSPTGTYVVLDTVGSRVNSYIDTGLDANEDYFYRLYAYGTLINSDTTDAVFATTDPVEASGQLTFIPDVAAFGNIDSTNNQDEFGGVEEVGGDTIYVGNFEEGDLTDFTSADDIFSASTTQKNGETYSMKGAFTTGDAKTAYVNFAAQSELWIRGYIYVPDAWTQTGGSYVYGIYGEASGGADIFGFMHRGDAAQWQLEGTGVVGGNYAYSQDAFQRYTLYWKKGTSDGAYKFYINDALQESGVDVNTGSVDIARINVGLQFSTTDTEGDIFWDDIIVTLDSVGAYTASGDTTYGDNTDTLIVSILNENAGIVTIDSANIGSIFTTSTMIDSAIAANDSSHISVFVPTDTLGGVYATNLNVYTDFDLQPISTSVTIIGDTASGGDPPSATAIYVADDATGSGNGSFDDEYTIGQGFSGAEAGDTVYIKAGTYSVNGLTVANGGTSGARIVFTAYDSGNKPVINNTGSSNYTITIGRPYITLKDLIINNATSYRYAIYFNDRNITLDGLEVDTDGSWAVIHGDNCYGAIIRNCTLEGSTSGNAIDIYTLASSAGDTVNYFNRSNNLLIENNILRDCPDHHGVNIFNSIDWVDVPNIDSAIIRNNYFENVLSMFFLRYTRYYQIYNNIGYNVQAGLDYTSQYESSYPNARKDVIDSHSLFANNTVVMTKGGGFPLWNSNSNYWEIKNNIFYGLFYQNQYIIWFIESYASGTQGCPTTGHNLSDNLYYNTGGSSYAISWCPNTYGTFAAWQSATGQGGNSIIDDNPAFVNPASNWHLQAASSAIDAGVDMSAWFTTDYNGDTRTGTWEMGAYIYVP